MNLFEKKSNEINPTDVSELDQLAKKWNISINDLSRAIVETGSLNTKELRSHIRKAKTTRKPLNINWSFNLQLDIIPRGLRLKFR